MSRIRCRRLTDQLVIVIHWLFDRLPRFSGAGIDATGLGAATAEAAAQRYGRVSEDELLVDPVKFSTAWYLTEMPPLKRAFEDAMVEIPLDTELHSDLRLFTTVDGVVKLPKIKSGERKHRHGDAGISLALAYAASRKRAISYGYRGGSRPRSGSEAHDARRANAQPGPVVNRDQSSLVTPLFFKKSLNLRLEQTYRLEVIVCQSGQKP